MATVRLEFTPEPAHVRTARLVGVAVARRAGVPDDQLDEVRLAIGEACARAVARHQRVGLRDVVSVAFSDGDRYVVQVWDHADDEEQITDEEQLTVDVSASLLQAIVKDLQVRPLEGGPGTEVQMAWPVRRASRLGR
ncbi:anti-sigma regulatory factor [Catellatospora methionotrophica]|uniref:Anti-sigma regulatory factor n=1 Tax=Catellatospora methionotrophica TaxID=121620 RepID=A0A8J3LE54_9ACTN|nr:ATP-binding protein [Catellatospora methionotrophica]GIG13854.1 anti-sigma regulatory factor [Catellatospora methionotrophica]